MVLEQTRGDSVDVRMMSLPGVVSVVVGEVHGSKGELAVKVASCSMAVKIEYRLD